MLWRITLSTAATPAHEAIVSGGDDALATLLDWMSETQQKREIAGFADVAFSPPVTLTIEEAR